jgi:hypothetical protein
MQVYYMGTCYYIYYNIIYNIIIYICMCTNSLTFRPRCAAMIMGVYTDEKQKKNNNNNKGEKGEREKRRAGTVCTL